MPAFGLALILFVLSHLAPSLPGVRNRIIASIGRRAYLTAYAALSVVLFGWVLHAAISAPTTLLWVPQGWHSSITLLISPIALFLMAAGLISHNPLSLSARPKGAHARPIGAVVTITRHPVLWGLILWSASHIPPNGDLRSLLFFGTLTGLAAAGFWLSDRRARHALGAQWEPLAAGTSIVPFFAVMGKRARLKWDGGLTLALVLALAATGWLLAGGHSAMFGVDPIAGTYY